MLEGYTFYNYLTDDDKELVEKINNHEILGASNHLNIFANIFIHLVEHNTSLEAVQIVAEIQDMKNFFMKTRGHSSIAVANGLHVLTEDINKEIKSKDTLLDQLKENKNHYEKENNENLSKILEYSNNELKDAANILLYDYSSTVEKAVRRILESNPEVNYNIYIAESSAIDGGSPYLPINKYENATLTFFPDAALAYYLSKSNVCLMGAETFYSDGTGFNTIGSDIVGLLCKEKHIPLYFITPMNKLDDRRMQGIKKTIVTTDYKEKYKFPDKLENTIDTIIPELIDVQPEYIYAFITEDGVVPSNQLYIRSLEYIQKSKGRI